MASRKYSLKVQKAAERVTNAVNIGPGWWLSGHLLADAADNTAGKKHGKAYRATFLFWVEHTAKYFKASDCKNHFLNFVTARPPEKEPSFFVWTVDAHNAVNKRNNKPVYTVKQARTAIAQKKDMSVFGPGGWALLHQTALQALREPEYAIRAKNIHVFMSHRKEYGNFYKLPTDGRINNLFSWSIAAHKEAGGMDLTLDEAEYIWGMDNVRDEPCSGPTPNVQHKITGKIVDENEEEYVYDIISSSESASDSDESSDSDDDNRRPFGILDVLDISRYMRK